MCKTTKFMKTNTYEGNVGLMPGEHTLVGAPMPIRPLPARAVCLAGEAVADATAKPRKRRTVLVPVDFSEASMKALDYAVSLARRMNAKVMLLHVLDGSYGEVFLDPSVRLRERARATEHARKKLTRMTALREDRRVPMESVVRRGNVEYEICRLAEAGLADLIVLGRKRRSVIGRLLLGSVIRAVMELAPCPVVVVPERDMESERPG
jgi:nucleotide-binding universal stress UspA family protein